MDFQGRHIVVTGGAGALGTAVVSGLVEAGAVCHVPCFDAAEAQHFRLRGHKQVTLTGAGNREHDLLMPAQAEMLRFRLVEAGHMAEPASLDQRRDHGGAERAGPAGDDDMTAVKVHNGIIADLELEARPRPGFGNLTAGENQWLISISPSSAAASTAPASPATPPAAAFALS